MQNVPRLTDYPDVDAAAVLTHLRLVMSFKSDAVAPHDPSLAVERIG